MLPLRDHHRSKKFPFFTFSLILINTLVFLYMVFLPKAKLKEFILSFSLIPSFILQKKNFFSIFSSMFLHASVGHLFSNMLFLNIFGPNLESKLGKIKYLIFYFVCGFFASFFEIFFHPFSKIPMVGASGAIAGIMGGYLYFFPANKIDVLFSFGWYLRVVTLPVWSMLIYWFFYQLFSGVGSLGLSYAGGIAYFAHIGGFLSGFFLARFFKRK